MRPSSPRNGSAIIPLLPPRLPTTEFSRVARKQTKSAIQACWPYSTPSFARLSHSLPQWIPSSPFLLPPSLLPSFSSGHPVHWAQLRIALPVAVTVPAESQTRVSARPHLVCLLPPPIHILFDCAQLHTSRTALWCLSLLFCRCTTTQPLLRGVPCFAPQPSIRWRELNFSRK